MRSKTSGIAAMSSWPPRRVRSDRRPSSSRCRSGMPVEKPGSGLGCADPVMIDLGPGVSFPLRGQIDRIDKVGTDIYCIWDYKTGSARSYEDQEYLNRGRQVQHCPVRHCRRADSPDRIGRPSQGGYQAGYYFPTKRGEGRR